MHFITFPVASTNIFPLSNSTKGGQLVTEFNLKSREMVATNPDIKYPVGPSFIHSLDDFKVKLLEDTEVADYEQRPYNKGEYCRYDGDTYLCIVDIPTAEPFEIEHWTKSSISTSILQVDPGRAVINGHYVETLAPMLVDLNLANAELKRNAQEELYGNLSIGIKSYFSTETTMAGSMLVENADNMYVGIQLVITKASDFKTPADCPAASQQGDATADIKLADFTYLNGTISKSSLLQNADATRYIDSRRIYDFDAILDEKYVTSEDLDEKKFYVFSGKYQSWCQASDSLMHWDSDPYVSMSTTPPAVGEATFITTNIDGTGDVKFVVPHKQLDGDIFNDQGEKLYYADKEYSFPTANYSKGTSGIVTKAYTDKIKDIASIINTYKQFTGGKQIMYLETLSADAEGNLSYDFPTDLSKFDIGDYILVREDFTVQGMEDSSFAPSTMYVVIPGGVVAVEPSGMTTTLPSGVRLGMIQHLYESEGASVPTTTSPTAEELLEMFDYNSYRGTTDDYFEIVYHTAEDDTTSYYYPVSATGLKSWSSPILLTGGVPLASEIQIGGFYNVSTESDYADAGYVYLDDTGHLRLMDYALLRTGSLAYQLCADYLVPSNNTLEYIQAYLDENVNARVAFKTHAELTSTPTMLHVYIPIPEEEGVINLYNIDSRFGTGVYIHFLADDKNKDYSNLVINISDCQKVRIDNSITTLTKGPIINIFRSCLYYDAELINYIRICDPTKKRNTLFSAYTNFTGFENLTLWYSRFTISDPDLVINGMEVSQPNVAMTAEEISFWDENISDDNHYSYALRSITLSGSGKLIGCSLYVGDGSTHQNVTEVNATTHTVIADKFKLPQGSALNYPMACVDDPISVTGTFTTAYKATNGVDWIVSDTIFSAKSGIYNPTSGLADGSITFNSSTYLVPAIYTTVDSAEAWGTNEYHIFYGGTTI